MPSSENSAIITALVANNIGFLHVFVVQAKAVEKVWGTLL